MKILQATPYKAYRSARLVMHEEYGVPYVEGTGEVPDGVDFTVFWQGAWREGRCYMGMSGNLTFVTYGDAHRFDLDEQIDEGIEIRLPLYTLTVEQRFQLARTYAQELGYIIVGDCTIVAMPGLDNFGNFTRVAVPVVGEPSSLLISITLSAWGDIRLIADHEIQHTAPPAEELQ